MARQGLEIGKRQNKGVLEAMWLIRPGSKFSQIGYFTNIFICENRINMHIKLS